MKNKLYGSPCQSGGAKCKFIFTLIAVIFLFNFSKAAAQSYPYVTFDESSGTLTLGYGDIVPTEGKVVTVMEHFVDQAAVTRYVGYDLVKDPTIIKKVVIESSFYSYQPKAIRRMFEGCTNLETIEGLGYINTTKVTSMSNMFCNCKNLATVTFPSSFTTPLVTAMDMMFDDCTSLQSLDLSSFSSESLVSMSSMFKGCSNLTSIKFGDNFTIEKVKSLDNVFDGCTQLSTLDLSKFAPTTALKSMSHTFLNCQSITTLNLSGFNTSAVTSMESLFSGCSKLKTITFGTNFKTDNVTSMMSMFQKCSSLTSLDLSKFNTENVEKISGMFDNCQNLKTIKFSSDFKTAKVQNMKNMFSFCKKLESLDLSSFDTENVTNMGLMFQNCQTLEHLDLSNFKTDNVQDMSTMFAGCSNLLTLDISNFTTPKITKIQGMFYNCSKLTTIRCNNTWEINIQANNKKNLFGIITYILGNEGTEYNSYQQDASDYAKVDKIKSSSIPGYFTTGKYKIFYDLYGGEVTSGTNPTEFDENSAELHIINPEKEGYTFLGWSGTPITGLNGKENKDVSIPAGSRGNRKYTANWQINQYTITFDTDGGTPIASITEDYGTSLTEPTTTKEGYDFAGWNISFPSTMPATNLVLTAQWTPKKYTLIFDTDGGNDFLAPVLKDYGADLSYISALSDPTKLGYDFVKWDKEIPTTMPATDLTITALWTPTVYNINLDYDGGALPTGKSNPTTFTIETETFTLEKPEKTGYTFAGWNTGKTVDPDGVITKGYYTEDLNYTATWNVNQYTITFNTDGGSVVAAITQDYNSAITAPANPTKEHYKFIGWDKAIPATMPAENITLTAQWEGIPHTITFDTDGGTPIDKMTVKYGENITKPADPVKTGYTLLGWDKQIPETMPDEDLTFKAQWQINQYTITFDTDGADPIEAITQYYNTAITAPANPAKKGFTFLGWQPALPATMPAQDLTVKAQWRDDRETIAVDFNGTTSFPTDADKFCNGNETSISLPFTITKGQPSEYIVTFENGTVVNGKVDANNNVLIEIPNDLESGVYKGSVVFNGDPELYKESDAYPVAITANIPKNAALQIYSDVLLVDNHDNNYSAYQWYKDGNAILGATLQFYSEPSFSGRYTVKITDKDGKEFMSCPIKTGVSVKNTKSSVKVYPNPATSGEQFTLEIEEYDPAKDYTIMIFTSNGTLVKKLTGLEKINTTTLPGGIYSGSLISNGEKSGFKVIVK